LESKLESEPFNSELLGAAKCKLFTDSGSYINVLKAALVRSVVSKDQYREILTFDVSFFDPARVQRICSAWLKAVLFSR
jgi:hypothetical protein